MTARPRRPLAARVIAALWLLKTFDVVARGPLALPTALWAGSVLLAACAAGWLLAGRDTSAAWATLVVAGAGFAVDFPGDLRRQHLVLLVGVALAASVARDGAERVLLWRTQLSALYGFAVLAKLNETFLGGDVLARALDSPLGRLLLPRPGPGLLLAAGAGLLVVEAVLAVTPWVPRLRRPGTLLAALLHGSALPLLATTPLVGLRLLLFGGLAVTLHAASAGLLTPARLTRQPLAHL